MQSVANVIAIVSKLSGETASVVAKDLIPSFNGTASSAKTLNDRFNFLTQSQYRQIELLELAGKKQEAATLTADLLNKSLKSQSEQLEINEGWWKKSTIALSDFWEAVKNIGAPLTDEEKIANFAKQMNAVVSSELGAFSADLSAAESNNAFAAYQKTQKEMMEKRAKIEEEARRKQAEKAKTDSYADAGGEKKRRDIIAETNKIYADLEFQQKVANATEFQRIEYEGERKKDQALVEMNKQNLEQRFNYAKELVDQYYAKWLAADYETQQKILEVSRKASEEVRKEQQGRLDAIMTEKEKLEIYEQNLLISEADYKVVLNRLKAEQEIAKIRANQQLTPEAKEDAIAKERDIERKANEVAKLAEKLEHLREVNSAVFKNMEDALDQFVQTGKFAFKDFAGSIIKDILAIYLKAQLLQLFNLGKSSLGGFFSGGLSGGTSGYAGAAVSSIGFAADGGYIDGPTIVGENGPELFLPRTAGTVVPNQQMSSMNSQPQVVYNGPYIANMSAIDTQSATQFLAKNKSAVWAANQSANRSMPQSR
jgi:lambda family phage tail tape measure protein